MTDVLDGYYAVPDPANPDTMTCWRVRRGELRPHPARAWYGPPRLLRKDAPGPPGSAAYIAWIRDYATARADWAALVWAAIEASPAAAGRQFAKATAHCCVCGRPLTSGASRVLGIGPDCRDRIPHEHFMAYLAEVHRTDTEKGTSQ